MAAGLGEEVEDAVRGEGGETRKGDGGGEEDWDVAGDVGGGPELSEALRWKLARRRAVMQVTPMVPWAPYSAFVSLPIAPCACCPYFAFVSLPMAPSHRGSFPSLDLKVPPRRERAVTRVPAKHELMSWL